MTTISAQKAINIDLPRRKSGDARVEFSSKAQTLARLMPYVRTARIPPSVWFTFAEWHQCPTEIAARLEQLPGDSWIVRSSCLAEDQAEKSNAGAFLSLPNVGRDDYRKAIDDVFASYGVARDEDEVLVQPMLTNVIRSGVIFSHDPGSGSPIRIINWSDGGDTALVTGGKGGRVWRQAAETFPPPHLQAPIALLSELLILFEQQPIDCEFAVTRDDSGDELLWLLQARPLVLAAPPGSIEEQTHRLTLIADRIRNAMRPHPFIVGQRTAFGVMPDWNPAEIIGVRPKPLALSLYRELVTDAIWAYQRHNYGYRNMRSFPLMPHFFGMPYIDVRLSFNSFIPGDLPDLLAGRLVDYYLQKLEEAPELHDKVEFEIVYSCFTFDLLDRLKELLNAGFSQIECQSIAESLRQLTNRIIHPTNGLWRTDAGRVDQLISRREVLFRSAANPLEKLYWLLEDAKRYGTLPFAGLARAGFIAVQMLKSLVAVGVFSPQDHDNFLTSLSTISAQLTHDRATLDRTNFLARYGHLRPGTYDLLLPRYDEAPDLYFDWSREVEHQHQENPFTVTLPQMREVSKLLVKYDLHPDAVGLFDFMQSAIELRESSKFHFTRNLSDLLSLAASYGERYGFSRDDMAYCDIQALKELHIGVRDPQSTLARSIAQGREQHAETQSLTLPPLITRPGDVWGFEWPESVPNFITRNQVTAPVSASYIDHTSLAGKIICIPNADPGFDWLFAYPIAGLITAWGGVNSHMAIRAGELGLPAVIGTGELQYQRYAEAKRLHLDCANRRIEILDA